MGPSIDGWETNEALPQTVEHVVTYSESGARSEAGPRWKKRSPGSKEGLAPCAYVVDPVRVDGHFGRALRELHPHDTHGSVLSLVEK